ncbi:amine sulfotransferase-like isoform X2 [Ciona intestinalis]
MDYEKLVADYKELFDKMKNPFTSTVDPEVEEMETYNGVEMQAIFRPYFAKYAYENYTPKENDVLLVTYPKCGTHWTAEILAELMYSKEKMEFWKSLMVMSVLESGPTIQKYEMLNQITTPNYLLSHQPAMNVNIEKYMKNKAKIVFVYRNPKDVAVSFFHFQKKVAPPQFRCDDWNEYVKMFMEFLPRSFCRKGETYLDHFLAWYQHRDHEQVLALCFEEMKLDPEKEIRKLSNFLGLDKSDDEINRVVDATSFNAMRQRQEEDSSTQINVVRKSINLVRKGIIGDWKNHFTVAQSEAMDRLVAEKTKGMDFKFIYSA